MLQGTNNTYIVAPILKKSNESTLMILAPHKENPCYRQGDNTN